MLATAQTRGETIAIAFSICTLKDDLTYLSTLLVLSASLVHASLYLAWILIVQCIYRKSGVLLSLSFFCCVEANFRGQPDQQGYIAKGEKIEAEGPGCLSTLLPLDVRESFLSPSQGFLCIREVDCLNARGP